MFNLDPPRGGQRASALGSGGVDGPSVLYLGSHSTLDSHPALDSRLKLDRKQPHRPPCNTNNPPKALDQRELGLAARQERNEGMDEKIKEVQRAVGYRKEPVRRHEEAVERREREV